MNSKISIIIALALALTSCKKEDWGQVFSYGEAQEPQVCLVNAKKDFEVQYNKVGNFYVVYNLKALAEGKGYRPEDKFGPFIKFDLEQGKISESSTEWDIAFRYATIIINGGEKTGRKDEPERNAQASAYIEKKAFEKVQKLDERKLQQDKSKNLAISDDVMNKSGVWFYNMKEHYVLPLSGCTIMIKSRNGKFYKMQIRSFYLGAPALPQPADESYGYYTFRYAKLK